MMKRTLHWLIVEPLYFWVALLFPLGAIVYAFGIARTELAIRIPGLMLQLAGILTVAWGIREAWVFFGLGDPLGQMRSWFDGWLSHCPFRKRHPINAATVAFGGNGSLSARAHTSWPLTPNGTVEERLVAIEKNIPLINERVSNIQSEFDRVARTFKDEISEIKNSTAQDMGRLQVQIKVLGTGNLHISAIGALWLFVGSILSTASTQLIWLVE
ncbi:MAG: hypothetical protein NW204_06725 [Xanthomonadaceae bacterium]|nr:hypothetical protein [Xanthomonadaceae bacterium]